MKNSEKINEQIKIGEAIGAILHSVNKLIRSAESEVVPTEAELNDYDSGSQVMLESSSGNESESNDSDDF